MLKLEERLKVINSLKLNTSLGIDGISSSLEKIVAHNIADVLLCLISFSLENLIFPIE